MPRRYIDPSLQLSSTPVQPGVVASQDEADAARRRFDQAHPFAPSGAFVAPTVMPPAGMPPGWGEGPEANGYGADSGTPPGFPPVQMVGGGWGYPTLQKPDVRGQMPDVGGQRSETRSQRPDAGGRRAAAVPGVMPVGWPPGATPGDLAQLIGDAGANYNSERDFARNVAPYLPTADMDPNVAANNMAYLNKRVAQAGGQMPDAGGQRTEAMAPTGMPPVAADDGFVLPAGMPPTGSQRPEARGQMSGIGGQGADVMPPPGMPPVAYTVRDPGATAPKGYPPGFFPAVRGTDRNGRPTLTQSQESLDAQASGNTPRARDAARVAQMAAESRAAANNPRLVNLGMDAAGRPIQRVVDRNGNSQAIPFEKPNPAYFEKPRVTEVDGVRFYQTGPGEAPKPIREDANTGLNPMVVGSISEQISALEQEKAQHQAAIVSGDNRYGFLNARDRTGRVQEIDTKLSGFRGMLGQKTAPTQAPAPAEPAAKPVAAAPAAKPSKSYQINGDQLSFDKANLLGSVQEALNDGAIGEEQARKILAQAGYKPKAKN